MLKIACSATAALLVACAPAALAQSYQAQTDQAQTDEADSPAAPLAAADRDGEITVVSPLLHPSAGLMNDHMHEGGEAMIGLRFERRRSSGDNVRGTERIADADIVAAGYSARTTSMEMDMVMLDLMYAPSDKVTLMVMPHYMWHRMEMVGIDPEAGSGGVGGGAGGGHHGGHGGSVPFGETHEHAAQGFGDTLVSASYRLARSRPFSAHATLGLWLPTGKTEKKNADGTYVHYMMQPGSGTWDVEPSLTVSGQAGSLGWGAQGGYRWRTHDRNDAGFAFGDRAQASVWASSLLASGLGATARAEYVHEGRIEGHYDGPHHHAAPVDRQANYGGDTVSLGLGLNWLLPLGARAPQLSGEIAVPVYQDLNGIQVPQDWRLSIGLSRNF